MTDGRAAHAMNFGDHLRAARTARGISVRDISMRTRIALRSLEALEQNEIGKLPGGIFSRAFVRAYAQEVGLDPDETVRLFVHQFPIDHVTAGSTDAVEGEIGRGQEAQRRRQRLGYLLTAAIGIPLVGLAAYLVSSARRPANASDLTPPGAAASAASPGGSGAAAGAVEGSAPGTAVRTALRTTSSGPTVSPTGAATAGANGAGVAGIGAGGAGSALTPASATTTALAAKGGASAALPMPDALRIAIAPEGLCWVRVKGDGALRYEGLLKAGDKQVGDAHDALELLIGDAGTFRFSINGHPGRALGKSGEVIVARITRTNWQDWLQH